MDKSDFQMAEHLECPTDSPSTVRVLFESSDLEKNRKMFYELIWPDIWVDMGQVLFPLILPNLDSDPN